MRQTLSRGMFAAAAATSLLSLCGSPALADSQANGSAVDSPGVVSGNDVQVPVEVPLNLCGNTIDVVAALDPAFGNDCAARNEGAEDDSSYGSGQDHDEDADGGTEGSPGVGSGNDVRVPVEVPLNVCGDSVGLATVLNPAFGNACAEDTADGYGDTPATTPPSTPPPGGKSTPPPADGDHVTPSYTGDDQPALAETGSEALLATSAASAALIAAGAVLYRRSRATSRR
ncbi:chaplin [Streptomyces doebereineriae]|uniref:Chaplin n=1 Tax=Streptomyces doebereineriae TaxID=3075528 RepID=A0ABU2VMV7_9ACTN|nr:chaplin [Streptomyces sp. DSM 41640]MDT0486933.1 chaplin [Streptomyces sp. DSM 41640]